MSRSIATRLTLASVLTLVSLLVITALALRSFSSLFQAASLIKNHHLQEASIFEDIRVLLTSAADLDHLFIVSGGRQDYHEGFNGTIGGIRGLLTAHAGLHVRVPITPPEVEGLGRLRAATDRLDEAHKAVVQALALGAPLRAQEISATASRQAAESALSVAKDLVIVERHESDELLAAARQAANRTHTLILIMALVATLISGAASASVIRSVTVPVRRLVDATRRVDRGNLSVRSGVTGSDEIGEMAQHFDHMVERLEAAFGEQERFLADVSHELRTPITIVRGHLELLERKDRTPAQVERAVAIGMDELDRMTRLVNELLVLVRATRADFLKLEPLDLPEFLEGVLGKAEAIAPRAWRLGTVAPVTLRADRDRLTQALLNLLRNAAEHTQPQGAIELSAAVRGEFVEMSVSDQGEGIPADLLPHVFERFRRGQRADSRPGWGLGLSIVQAIARAHAGDVRVRSRRGAGSTFTLVLPLHVEH